MPNLLEIQPEPHISNLLRSRIDAGDFPSVAFHLLKRGDGDFVGHDLNFRLEHRVERLGRIGQRLGINGNLALDQPAYGGEITLRVDAERI